MKTNNSSSFGKVGNVYRSPALGALTIKSLTLDSADILSWKKAVQAAKSATNPRRNLLYDLYNNIILDPHLSAVINKRRVAITNKKISWIDNDGTVNSDKLISKEVIETPWLYDILKHYMDTISWGHSLLEFNMENGNTISKVHLLNRYNVLPDYGFISYTYQNFAPSPSNGIYYREEPAVDARTIEIIAPDEYGLMMKAAPCVIYKRNGIGDWAQFAEIFGFPFRVGKYNPFDDNTRRLLEQGMEDMGGAGYAVIPDGTSLEFHDNNGTGKSEVFENLAHLMDKEVSKLYLGGTMTIHDGSSKAQAEVHSKGEDAINLSDLIGIEHFLNYTVKPKLAALLPIKSLSTGMFKFPETGQIPLIKRIEIDMELSKRITFPEDYWYKTYGIDVPQNATMLPIANNPY